METNLFNRVQATLLALATAALFVLAVLNLVEERKFQQPDDGIWWREAPNGLRAERVLPDKPGQVAGIQTGDLLTAVATCSNLRAERVPTDKSGQVAGIQTGDLLNAVATSGA